MKKKVVFTALACVIGGLFIVFALIIGKNTDNFGIDLLKKLPFAGETDGKTYSYDYTWDLEGYDTKGVDIEWINGSITVRTCSGNTVKITESSSKPIAEDDRLDMNASGGTLKIKWKDELISFGILQNKYKDLVVEIPASLAGNMKVFKCVETAGGVSVSDVKAAEGEVVTTSADIELKSVGGEEWEISTTSGDVTLMNADFKKELKCGSASGNISVTSAKTRILGIDVVSGDVKYIGAADELTADTVSGDIYAELVKCPSLIKADAVSGDITVAMPDSKGFEVKYDSVSGTFRSDFEMDGISNGKAVAKSGRGIYGDGSASFSFDSTSGNATLKKL